MPNIDADLLIRLHDGSTWFMTGVIWVVQVVHYPLFSKVGRDTYEAYQSAHMARITPVVLPPMVVELGTASWLALSPADPERGTLRMVGLGLVVAIWASTFLLQVPRHARLERGFDAAAHRGLVGTNWVRTALWTARALFFAGG